MSDDRGGDFFVGFEPLVNHFLGVVVANDQTSAILITDAARLGGL